MVKKKKEDKEKEGQKTAASFYKEPVILNSETHKKTKCAPVEDYSFTKASNSCVVLGQEFLEAAKYYPVLFSKNDETIVPVVFLGIDANLFVGDDGKWEKDHYIPAFIRRYPFIIAEGFAGDGSLTVCVDSKYEGFAGKDGERLFTDKGEQTQYMKNVVTFLQKFHQQFGATKIFMDYIKELDIFKDVNAQITLQGDKKYRIPNLLMVDETKVRQLADDKIVELVKRGYLAWIYAHLYSLTNFGKILNKAK